MINNEFHPPTTCHLCSRELRPHLLYLHSGAVYCPEHGDFFVQRLRGEEPRIIFMAFSSTRPVKKVVKKTPTVELAAEKPPEENHPTTFHIPQLKPPLARRVAWVMEPAEYLASVRVKANNPRGGQSMLVRCDQTGNIYPSVRNACDEMNIDRQSMFKHLKGERRAVGGYTFTRVADPRQNSSPLKPPVLSIKKHHAGCPIQCDQTKKIFSSIRQASLDMVLDRDSIRDHLVGNRPHVCGYTFTKITNNHEGYSNG